MVEYKVYTVSKYCTSFTVNVENHVWHVVLYYRYGKTYNYESVVKALYMYKICMILSRGERSCNTQGFVLYDAFDVYDSISLALFCPMLMSCVD
jgi:hypothetical protein